MFSLKWLQIGVDLHRRQRFWQELETALMCWWLRLNDLLKSSRFYEIVICYWSVLAWNRRITINLAKTVIETRRNMHESIEQRLPLNTDHIHMHIFERKMSLNIVPDNYLRGSLATNRKCHKPEDVASVGLRYMTLRRSALNTKNGANGTCNRRWPWFDIFNNSRIVHAFIG